MFNFRWNKTNVPPGSNVCSFKNLLIFSFITGSLLISSIAPTEAKEKPFAFRDFFLGMALSEFKAMKHPDKYEENVEAPTSEPVCTGGLDKHGLPVSGTIVNTIEIKMGIIKCVFYGPRLSGSEGSVGVSLGNTGYASYEYSFKFAPSADKSKKQLIEIQLATNIKAFRSIRNAVEKRFGKPKILPRRAARNGLGNQVEVESYLWKNSVSSIYMEGPWAKITNMVVIYSLDAPVRKLQKLIESEESSGM